MHLSANHIIQSVNENVGEIKINTRIYKTVICSVVRSSVFYYIIVVLGSKISNVL
jgi:hypothetical protein